MADNVGCARCSHKGLCKYEDENKRVSALILEELARLDKQNDTLVITVNCKYFQHTGGNTR